MDFRHGSCHSSMTQEPKLFGFLFQECRKLADLARRSVPVKHAFARSLRQGGLRRTKFCFKDISGIRLFARSLKSFNGRFYGRKKHGITNRFLFAAMGSFFC